MTSTQAKRKRQRPGDDRGERSVPTRSSDSQHAVFHRLYRKFRHATGCPPEYGEHLVCPVFRLLPGEYRNLSNHWAGVATCRAHGFKDFGRLNEHIRRAHGAEAKLESGIPTIEAEIFAKWSSKTTTGRSGVKSTPKYLRDTWWKTALDLGLVGSIPNPMPKSVHLVHPGPEAALAVEYAIWLLDVSSRPANKSAQPRKSVPTQVVATGTIPSYPSSAFRKPMVAELLSDRVDDGTEYAQLVLKDSGYGSMVTDKDLDTHSLETHNAMVEQEGRIHEDLEGINLEEELLDTFRQSINVADLMTEMELDEGNDEIENFFLQS